MFVTAITCEPCRRGVPRRLERVDRLAGLRHGQRQRVRAQHRVAVAELAGDLDLDGQPRPMLDRVLRHEPGMERRAARDDEHLRDLAQHVVGDPQLVERQPAAVVRPTSVSRIASGCSSISLRMNQS